MSKPGLSERSANSTSSSQSVLKHTGFGNTKFGSMSSLFKLPSITSGNDAKANHLTQSRGNAISTISAIEKALKSDNSHGVSSNISNGLENVCATSIRTSQKTTTADISLPASSKGAVSHALSENDKHNSEYSYISGVSTKVSSTFGPDSMLSTDCPVPLMPTSVKRVRKSVSKISVHVDDTSTDTFNRGNSDKSSVIETSLAVKKSQKSFVESTSLEAPVPLNSKSTRKSTKQTTEKEMVQKTPVAHVVSPPSTVKVDKMQSKKSRKLVKLNMSIDSELNDSISDPLSLDLDADMLKKDELQKRTRVSRVKTNIIDDTISSVELNESSLSNISSIHGNSPTDSHSVDESIESIIDMDIDAVPVKRRSSRKSLLSSNCSSSNLIQSALSVVGSVLTESSADVESKRKLPARSRAVAVKRSVSNKISKNSSKPAKHDNPDVTMNAPSAVSTSEFSVPSASFAIVSSQVTLSDPVPLEKPLRTLNEGHDVAVGNVSDSDSVTSTTTTSIRKKPSFVKSVKESLSTKEALNETNLVVKESSEFPSKLTSSGNAVSVQSASALTPALPMLTIPARRSFINSFATPKPTESCAFANPPLTNSFINVNKNTVVDLNKVSIPSGASISTTDTLENVEKGNQKDWKSSVSANLNSSRNSDTFTRLNAALEADSVADDELKSILSPKPVLRSRSLEAPVSSAAGAQNGTSQAIHIFDSNVSLQRTTSLSGTPVIAGLEVFEGFLIHSESVLAPQAVKHIRTARERLCQLPISSANANEIADKIRFFTSSLTESLSLQHSMKLSLEVLSVFIRSLGTSNDLSLTAARSLNDSFASVVPDSIDSAFISKEVDLLISFCKEVAQTERLSSVEIQEDNERNIARNTFLNNNAPGGLPHADAAMLALECDILSSALSVASNHRIIRSALRLGSATNSPVVHNTLGECASLTMNSQGSQGLSQSNSLTMVPPPIPQAVLPPLYRTSSIDSLSPSQAFDDFESETNSLYSSPARNIRRSSNVASSSGSRSSSTASINGHLSLDSPKVPSLMSLNAHPSTPQRDSRIEGSAIATNPTEVVESRPRPIPKVVRFCTFDFSSIESAPNSTLSTDALPAPFVASSNQRNEFANATAAVSANARRDYIESGCLTFALADATQRANEMKNFYLNSAASAVALAEFGLHVKESDFKGITDATQITESTSTSKISLIKARRMASERRTLPTALIQPLKCILRAISACPSPRIWNAAVELYLLENYPEESQVSFMKGSKTSSIATMLRKMKLELRNDVSFLLWRERKAAAEFLCDQLALLSIPSSPLPFQIQMGNSLCSAFRFHLRRAFNSHTFDDGNEGAKAPTPPRHVVHQGHNNQSNSFSKVNINIDGGHHHSAHTSPPQKPSLMLTPPAPPCGGVGRGGGGFPGAFIRMERDMGAFNCDSLSSVLHISFWSLYFHREELESALFPHSFMEEADVNSPEVIGKVEAASRRSLLMNQRNSKFSSLDHSVDLNRSISSQFNLSSIDEDAQYSLSEGAIWSSGNNSGGSVVYIPPALQAYSAYLQQQNDSLSAGKRDRNVHTLVQGGVTVGGGKTSSKVLTLSEVIENLPISVMYLLLCFTEAHLFLRSLLLSEGVSKAYSSDGSVWRQLRMLSRVASLYLPELSYMKSFIEPHSFALSLLKESTQVDVIRRLVCSALKVHALAYAETVAPSTLPQSPSRNVNSAPSLSSSISSASDSTESDTTQRPRKKRACSSRLSSSNDSRMGRIVLDDEDVYPDDVVPVNLFQGWDSDEKFPSVTSAFSLHQNSNSLNLDLTDQNRPSAFSPLKSRVNLSLTFGIEDNAADLGSSSREAVSCTTVVKSSIEVEKQMKLKMYQEHSDILDEKVNRFRLPNIVAISCLDSTVDYSKQKTVVDMHQSDFIYLKTEKRFSVTNCNTMKKEAAAVAAAVAEESSSSMFDDLSTVDATFSRNISSESTSSRSSTASVSTIPSKSPRVVNDENTIESTSKRARITKKPANPTTSSFTPTHTAMPLSSAPVNKSLGEKSTPVSCADISAVLNLTSKLDGNFNSKTSSSSRQAGMPKLKF